MGWWLSIGHGGGNSSQRLGKDEYGKLKLSVFIKIPSLSGSFLKEG